MFFSLHDITYNPRLTCPFYLAPSEPISSSVLQANGGTDRQTDGQTALRECTRYKAVGCCGRYFQRTISFIFVYRRDGVMRRGRHC